jgi:hypothetical protein
MGVSDLGLRPPPSSGQTIRSRKVGRDGSDEWVNVVEYGATVAITIAAFGFHPVNSTGVRIGRRIHARAADTDGGG